MPDISKITLPSGTTYDIKDAVARASAAGGIKFRGVTTTPIADGDTTATYVINGETLTAENGDMVIYGNKELVYSTVDNKWHELGDTTDLGDLAYKDSATGSVTPAGTISTPTINIDSAGATTTVNSITAVGTLPAWSATVANENLTISWDTGTLPTKGADTTVKTGDATYTSTQPTFSGTAATVTVT